MFLLRAYSELLRYRFSFLTHRLFFPNHVLWDIHTDLQVTKITVRKDEIEERTRGPLSYPSPLLGIDYNIGLLTSCPFLGSVKYLSKESSRIL